MIRVAKNQLERVFGHTKNLAAQAHFSHHYQKSPFGPKKCSLAEQVEKHVKFELLRVRKWASKIGCTMGWEGLERILYGVPYKKWGEKGLRPPFQLATQRKHIFFLIRQQKLEYQVVIWRFLYWSKFIAYVVVVEWDRRTVYWSWGGRRARHDPSQNTHFHSVTKNRLLVLKNAAWLNK